MLKRLTPFTILVLAGASGIGAAALALFISLSQPWLGVSLAVDSESGLVRIVDVAADGPSQAMEPGRALTGVGGVALEAGDLIEEPDLVDSYTAMARFLDRQSRLHSVLTGGTVTLETGSTPAMEQQIAPRPVRPIASLPPAFWAQVFTGLISLIVGAWVWSLRPRELSTQLLALASLGMLASSLPAAIYSSREIALPGALLRALSAINHFGALGVGVAVLALFLVYPRRLVTSRALWMLPVLYGSIWVLDTAWLGFPGPTFGVYVPFLILTGGIAAAVLVQYRVARTDPAARAAIRWLALSVALSAGIFVVVVLLPILFGMQSSLSQGYAFALFGMLYYLGIAAGVARFRLFELDRWAFSVLTYFGAVVVLIVFDAILISFVAVDPPGAFALSLLVVALIYLPSRDWLSRRLMARPEVDREELFGNIIDVAMASGGAREDHWRQLLKGTFQPLHISSQNPTALDRTTLEEDGLALVIPAISGLGPLKLTYAHAGRQLFNPQDRRLAAEICAMLAHAISSRAAHEKGAAEERLRIARDMHDNMGAQLLSALHSETRERKDTLIRETISDLRDIVNNAARGGKTIEELLADLKLEALERLAAAQIALEWHEDCEDAAIMFAPNAAHSLRSMVREVISNTIRHSGATKVRVNFEIRDGSVRLDISDDGSGLPADMPESGNGLFNVETRLLALKGTLVLEDTKPGLSVRARFPLCEGELT